MKKINTKNFLFGILIMIIIFPAWAQVEIRGIVKDASSGETLPGVNVLVQGSTTGTTTDLDGNYSLRVSSNAKLQFSYIGYKTQVIDVNNRSQIDIFLEADSQNLDEFVVTAMGVKKERKSLGYAFQEIKTGDLVDSRENNIANALIGKVSGLQVMRSSSSPAASSKIILRGFNSLTGDNQPLIVVDGVPMSNFTGAANNDFWNPSADMGNGLGDLNPEDIESMSVLKGGAASALYGSRAGNGVILITTKSGRAKDGTGISYSATVGFENIFMQPKIQRSFGQGSNGSYDPLSGLSWGPQINGQQVQDWKGDMVPLQAYDNLGNFFRTGNNTTHNLSFQQSLNKNTTIYSSLNYLRDNSKTPGVTLDRLNLMTKVTSNFGKNERWMTDIKVQYMNTEANNRPVGGNNSGNYYGTVLNLPNTVDMLSLKEGMDRKGVQQVWYNPQSSQVNPYWASNNILNQDVRNRFLMNATIQYKFTDWLNAQFQAGTDIFTTKRTGRTYTGAPVNSSYSIGFDSFFENNYIFSLNANKENIKGSKWGGAASIFGQVMTTSFSSLNGNAGELEVPNLFFLGNSVGLPGISESFNRKQINSIFATAEINYDRYWFLNVTGRNDWSSALGIGNRSFFYPSISTSLVVSEMIGKNGGVIPKWMEFAKIRLSYAETGSDLSPYQIFNVYNIGRDPRGYTTASRRGTLFNENIRSELVKSIEAGFDMGFFDNRFGVDFTYYKTNAVNQILTIPMNPLSGYTGRLVNAGDIENRGVEIVFNASILRSNSGLNWDISSNFARNINVINSLHEEVRQVPLGGYDNVTVFGEVGQLYGAIYGTRFRRVLDESSPHFGKLLLNDAGLPVADNGIHLLGNQTANYLLGVTNTFKYKNMALSVQVDGRFGGQFFAGTNAFIQRSGLAEATVVNGRRDDFIVDGVISSGEQLVQNTVSVSHQDYWNAVSGVGNLGITEQNIYDATNMRIRLLQLSYNVPQKILGDSFVRSMRLSFTGNNLLMLVSHANGVDPESVFATATNAVGFELLSFPTSRSYFFTATLGF
ncbi:SusC/RagA family TonB-linked outer membrane protein [Belliella kenyensis]|uniref:SusC/RagA family TonB-linked outer membrane protein n=1 Tax=Belliella kenyensis TaxID=1472724 RepID=A0ABV8ESH0_9BACT|nr:SusC/RagA family TonB-linked outer membrane protein [Belliella kenyensis]MCH7402792.1 SusC/RagA family TonB-linked outer membrane protein [Belliella kenyensis]MDN3602497.1 SusC/RagA family TonB-linked outer membrane protein [Belliella kenyensis]